MARRRFSPHTTRAKVTSFGHQCLGRPGARLEPIRHDDTTALPSQNLLDRQPAQKANHAALKCRRVGLLGTSAQPAIRRVPANNRTIHPQPAGGERFSKGLVAEAVGAIPFCNYRNLFAKNLYITSFYKNYCRTMSYVVLINLRPKVYPIVSTWSRLCHSQQI